MGQIFRKLYKPDYWVRITISVILKWIAYSFPYKRWTETIPEDTWILNWAYIDPRVHEKPLN